MVKLNWHTGNPPKSGMYYTTRKFKFSSDRFITLNEWRGADYKYLDSYENKVYGWMIGDIDESETIAWVDFKDIEPYNEE